MEETTMTNEWRCRPALSVAFLLLLTAGSIAAPKTTNITTTNVVHDATSATQLLLRSDDFNGSQQATYSSYLDSANWHFYLSPGRTLYVTPDSPIDGAQPVAPPAGYYSQNIEVYSRCDDQYGNAVYFPNILTASGNCSLGVDFGYNGTVYKLLMNPSGRPPTNSSCPATGCPPTGVTTVTCNAVGNGQCVSWTIVPNASAGKVNVASLFRLSNGKAGWIYIGQYYNTFRIDITNP
jgi:hypothetical protein